MTVIADSSPRITLARIGYLDLLPQLYKKVVITPEVYEEVVISGSGLAGALQVSLAPWIDVRMLGRPADLVAAQSLFGLGLGELSVILLGQELDAEILLVDDIKARKLERGKGRAVLGCVGLLYDAFGLGLVSDLTDAYRRLTASGAYVDRSLLENILGILSLPPL